MAGVSMYKNTYWYMVALKRSLNIGKLQVCKLKKMCIYVEEYNQQIPTEWRCIILKCICAVHTI